MTGSSSPRTAAVAGWALSLLDLGSIHAPETWVFPHGQEDVFAWLPSNALLCTRPGVTVLVDCGIGPFIDSFGVPVRHVSLEDAIAGAGALPESVQILALSHLDVDHAGGIPGLRGNGLLQAEVVVLDRVLEKVLDGSTERSEVELWVEQAFREAPIDIATVPDGGEVVHGMRIHSAPGHRSGHACVELTGDGDRFVYLADVIHHREHVEHPEWDVLHDTDPEIALATRRTWIDELSGSGAIVACSHIDSFGRIEPGAGGGSIWVDVQ